MASLTDLLSNLLDPLEGSSQNFYSTLSQMTAPKGEDEPQRDTEHLQGGGVPEWNTCSSVTAPLHPGRPASQDVQVPRLSSLVPSQLPL